MRFTSHGGVSVGGWLYTGDGAGWTGATVRLWDCSTSSQVASKFVSTGAASSRYLFTWDAPVTLVASRDYILSTDKDADSGYPGNADGAAPPTSPFYTFVGWRYAVGEPAFPNTVNTDRTGVYPQICDAPGYCQYGTELTAAGQFSVTLTPGLISTWLFELDLEWAAPFFVAFWYTTVNAQTLCGTQPPETPVLTLDELLRADTSITWRALEAIAWSQLCKCSPAPPGSPSPPAYPPPVFTEPPGLPPTAPLVCSNLDICSALDTINSEIAAILANMAHIREQVDLVQRQKVPFAYIPGHLTTGLTGKGELTVSGILGLAVQVTDVPSRAGLVLGDPNELFDLGWITIGTAEGWQQSRRIDHNPMLILGIEGAETLVGYSLTPGVTINIQELVREPS